jgi:hypothetical protein
MQSADADQPKNATLNGLLILAMGLESWGLLYVTVKGVWAMANVWSRQASLGSPV